MSPQMITAIAYLISEAVLAGVSIEAILREARERGGVPDERWDEALAGLQSAVDAWRRARGGPAG